MRQELFIEILEITKKQQKALEQDDIDLFKSLVDDKQLLMNKVDELNRKYKEETSEEEKLVLREIIELNNLNQKEFNRQYEEAKDKLKQTRTMKRRDNMYANSYSYGTHVEEGIFFDKKNR